MGLDSVELLMAIEEHFDLEISGEDAATLSKVGDMHAYVVSKLQRKGLAPDSNAVLEELRVIIAREGGVDIKHVTPDADIVRDLGIN